MGNKNNIKNRKRYYRNANRKLFNRCITSRVLVLVLSLVLFILSVNPLSFLLKSLPGYKIGEPGKRGISISHLFFVDDLKTYASDKKCAKLQLDMISQCTRDISMQFGSDKYICLILKGISKNIGKIFNS